jgi:hypothetical protein
MLFARQWIARTVNPDQTFTRRTSNAALNQRISFCFHINDGLSGSVIQVSLQEIEGNW